LTYEIAIQTASDMLRLGVYEHASRRLTTGKEDTINGGMKAIFNDEEGGRMLPYPTPLRKIAREIA
jgi:hypothetical protein